MNTSNPNMTVADLKSIIEGLPDDMDVIVPIATKNDANAILGFRHVRTSGILRSSSEQHPAFCLNPSENGADMATQINMNCQYVVCEKVLF